jgi:hypothetical protein
MNKQLEISLKELNVLVTFPHHEGTTRSYHRPADVFVCANATDVVGQDRIC